MLLMMALAHSNYLMSMPRMMPWSNHYVNMDGKVAIGSGQLLSTDWAHDARTKHC